MPPYFDLKFIGMIQTNPKLMPIFFGDDPFTCEAARSLFVSCSQVAAPLSLWNLLSFTDSVLQYIEFMTFDPDSVM